MAGVTRQFHSLTGELALVLVFVEIKMTIVYVYKIPIALSLRVIATLIGGAIVASLRRPRLQPEAKRLVPTQAA